MEIYRTDGGGRYHYNERLLDLMKDVAKVDEEVFNEINILNDHKGDLYIHLNNDKNSFYIYTLFLSSWYRFNEYSVRVYYKGNQIHSS